MIDNVLEVFVIFNHVIIQLWRQLMIGNVLIRSGASRHLPCRVLSSLFMNFLKRRKTIPGNDLPITKILNKHLASHNAEFNINGIKKSKEAAQRRK